VSVQIELIKNDYITDSGVFGTVLIVTQRGKSSRQMNS